MGWTFSPEITYMLRFIPLVRGGYAMAIVVGWLTYNKASSLFVSYLTMLLATVYFASLAFFVMEHKVNPLVTGYGDALWWAFMDVTTVGSNIIAVTATGRVLSVLLAALGISAFAPPLDGSGNSVKAQLAIKYIMNKLGLNVFNGEQVTVVE